MRFCYLIIIHIFLAGCLSNELSIEEFNTYLRDEDNGVFKTSTNNGIRADVVYKPTDAFVYQEVKNSAVNAMFLDSIRRKYSCNYYFLLSLSHDNQEALHSEPNLNEYSELLQTLSFRMDQHVMITTSTNDTIPVADFILNRTYGLSSSTDLLFVFNNERASHADWVQFNLNEFGLGMGNQQFRFKTKDLKDVPLIDFIINP